MLTSLFHFFIIILVQQFWFFKTQIQWRFGNFIKNIYIKILILWLCTWTITYFKTWIAHCCLLKLWNIFLCNTRMFNFIENTHSHRLIISSSILNLSLISIINITESYRFSILIHITLMICITLKNYLLSVKEIILIF